jgi:cobalamin biosynthesis protein CbiM
VHIPDGFFGAGASLGAGAVSVGTLGVAVRRTREVLADREIPLAALTAAFIFAVQMLNFPVVAGTSGHLFGGALAAVLVGPWVGMIAVAVVLVVQALFADGGLTAIGLNVLLISIIPAGVGWIAFRALRAVLRSSPASVVAAAGLAAFVSVVVAAAAFTVLYALDGTADIAVGRLAAAMLGVHALIGIGEAVITALTVSAVLGARPDLVRGAADLGPVPAATSAATSGGAR